jgi:SET domain-containing protein
LTFRNQSFPKIQRSCEIISVPLVVRPSRIHAVGVFTTTPIRKGTRVVEYTGPRLTPEEADRLYDGTSRTYLYGLEDGKTVIDGHGLGAYLNHSCDPNCEVDEIRGRVWLFALRDIAAAEELVWDYNLYDDEAPAPCHCGSPRCRGTMYSKEWMARMRRREARRQARRQKANAGAASTSIAAPAIRPWPHTV